MDKVSISETAIQLNVSIDTIRRWEKKGLIKAHRNQLGHRVFKLDEVKALKAKLDGSAQQQQFKVLCHEPTNFTAVDLFAGAGGTALGLENAGFQHLLVNEFDKHAAATLRKNRAQWHVLEQDVHTVDFSHLAGQVDLLEGGFPCQAFSYAGNKKGFLDTRGTLFHEFARAIKEIQPKVAIGENVRGLLTHDNGRTLKIMLNELLKLGYRVGYKVLRAQYLDTPQKRERLIIVALREDITSPLLVPKERDYTISLREALAGVPASPGAVYAPWKAEIMAKVPEGGYWKDLPEADQKSYMKASYYHTGGRTGLARRLAWDEPSLTLTCSPAQKQTERCHPEQTRPLTVREYARIQTFPDDWEFAGGLTAQYKQIGNAVPVNMGFHIGMAVRAMLGDGDPGDFTEITPVLLNEDI